MKLEPGLLIASGKYRLRACLGYGGQAEVWEAEQQGLAGFSKRIVLKLVAPGHRDKRLYQNLLREAQLSSLFHHPNVAEVYDVGEDTGLLYIAMERIHGRDLEYLLEQSMMKREKAFPWPLAVGIVIDICKGLSHVHNKKGDDGKTLQLVHRDIKPSNILLNIEGFAKLIDFGVAKTANMTKITQQGAVRGTPAYMAPEQIRSLPVDKRSDIFSLGAVLYELCTGHRAFDDDELYALFFSVLSKKPSSPKTHSPDVPDALEEAIYRSLFKKPEGRFQDAEAFQQVLEDILKEEGESAGHPQLAAFYKELVGDHATPIKIIEELADVRPFQHTVTYGTGTPREQTLDSEEDLQAAQEQIKALFPALSPELLNEPVLTLTPKNPALASASSPVTEQSVEVPLGVLDITGTYPEPSFEELTEPALALELTETDEAELARSDADVSDPDITIPVHNTPFQELRNESMAPKDAEPTEDSEFPLAMLGKEQSEPKSPTGGSKAPAPAPLFPPSSSPRRAPSLFPEDERIQKPLLWLAAAGGAFFFLALFFIWGPTSHVEEPGLDAGTQSTPLRPMLQRESQATQQKGAPQIPATPRPKRLQLEPRTPAIPRVRASNPATPRRQIPPTRLVSPKRLAPPKRPVRRKGRIRFRLRPSCMLYEGRRRLGLSNRVLLRRAPGWRRFRCINRRQKLYKRFSVKVRAGRTTTYTRRFRKGRLFLVTYPWSAVHVYPFGKIGFSQAAISMWSGRYRVTLYKEGKKRQRKRLWVRIRAGRTTRPRVIRW